MKKEYRCPWCCAKLVHWWPEYRGAFRGKFVCRNCHRSSPTALTKHLAMLRWELEREMKLAERRAKK